jgi:hypothetical protein
MSEATEDKPLTEKEAGVLAWMMDFAPAGFPVDAEFWKAAQSLQDRGLLDAGRNPDGSTSLFLTEAGEAAFWAATAEPSDAEPGDGVPF